MTTIKKCFRRLDNLYDYHEEYKVIEKKGDNNKN